MEVKSGFLVKIRTGVDALTFCSTSFEFILVQATIPTKDSIQEIINVMDEDFINSQGTTKQEIMNSIDNGNIRYAMKTIFQE